MKYTKNTLKKIIFLAILTITLCPLPSCYLPSPLYGTWCNSTGIESINFKDDGTFEANISSASDEIKFYKGEWATLDSTLILKFTFPSSYSRNMEWDIRGAVLILEWTADNTDTETLTLYHTSRK